MNALPPELTDALADYLIAWGDDDLILGQRDSEWCGHAPIVEEDIAFANLALDEIGHAQLRYELAAGLLGKDPQTYPDQLVYFRPAEGFRCARLVEMPRGDWAFSILRQYLCDTAELARLEAVQNSTPGGWPPLVEASAKIYKEEVYHLRHTRAWAERLAGGTQESHRRMQAALDTLWSLSSGLFATLPGEAELVAAGLVPSSQVIQVSWREPVSLFLQTAGLSLPNGQVQSPERGEHDPALIVLIAEMQSVARLDPQAGW